MSKKNRYLLLLLVGNIKKFTNSYIFKILNLKITNLFNIYKKINAKPVYKKILQILHYLNAIFLKGKVSFHCISNQLLIVNIYLFLIL